MVTTAGYQGTPAPNQWFGGPALSTGAGSMVLRDARGLVADSLNYGLLVDPWAAEGYQGGTGTGCTVATPALAADAGRSASRYPDGNDTDSNCTDFITSGPTPGAANLFALDPGPLVSLQMTTAGGTPNSVKHNDTDDLVVTAPVTAGSSANRQAGRHVGAGGRSGRPRLHLLRVDQQARQLPAARRTTSSTCNPTTAARCSPRTRRSARSRATAVRAPRSSR